MDDAKLRAWWSHRQGLDGALAGKSPAEVLSASGWARSVGGAGPYLTLFARAGTGRQAVDDALARQEIHELPGPRGCTYVVPAADFALALKVGQGFADQADLKMARKLGVTDKEIERLSNAVLRALEEKPLDPEELRQATQGIVRSLGEEGKKKGLTTTLPVALGMLQSAGEIRRVPTNGRLDQQRYRYALWRPNPLGKFRLSREQAFTELALRFFTWIGPATIQEFHWFSGLGVKAVKAAVEPLGLEPIEDGSERLILPKYRAEHGTFQVPKRPQYVLVSSLDGISHLRRDVRGLLSAEDLGRAIFKDKTFAGGLADLPCHAILDRGRLVGLWEYDVMTQSIAWVSFVVRDTLLTRAVARTEAFVRDELGDARSFSLDTPRSRAPRIEALRKAAES
jgi:hypothetical protein